MCPASCTLNRYPAPGKVQAMSAQSYSQLTRQLCQRPAGNPYLTPEWDSQRRHGSARSQAHPQVTTRTFTEPQAENISKGALSTWEQLRLHYHSDCCVLRCVHSMFYLFMCVHHSEDPQNTTSKIGVQGCRTAWKTTRTQ